MNNSLFQFGWLDDEKQDDHIYGVAVATVVDNIDLLGEARVQLNLPWVPGFLPWARVATTMAGMMRGTYFIPQIGDEVLVAFNQDQLVVYGGSGRAARSWDAFDAIVRSLRDLEGDQTLLVQSGKPVGVFRTHEWAPRVIIANALLVPQWATQAEFRRLESEGLTMYGQMTAGSWIYIGTQGISTRAPTKPSPPSPPNGSTALWPGRCPLPPAWAAWAGPYHLR